VQTNYGIYENFVKLSIDCLIGVFVGVSKKDRSFERRSLTKNIVVIIIIIHFNTCWQTAAINTMNITMTSCHAGQHW